jgi:hypothetical protein
MPVAAVFRRIGAVHRNDQRQPIFHGVVNVARRVRRTDAAVHAERRLSRGHRVAARHRHDVSFVSRENQFQLGPVDHCVAERAQARAVADEQIIDTGLQELLGEHRAAVSFERFPIFFSRRIGMGDRNQILQNRLSRRHAETGRGHGLQKTPPRKILIQVISDQTTHRHLREEVGSERVLE